MHTIYVDIRCRLGIGLVYLQDCVSGLYLGNELMKNPTNIDNIPWQTLVYFAAQTKQT
jgi:hypothetical protein